MNVLIVDDSIQTVKAIKVSIDWKRLGIAEVYTAYNIYQAQDILSKHDINIMISDIEMPQGSGLDLIRWLKTNSLNTESILLTCHAEFEYAKTAIELGSFDYLVKPIPFEKLEEIISKLIAKIEAGSKLKKQSEYWLDNQPLIEEKFWHDLITGKISMDSNSIENYALKRNVHYNKEGEYLIILFAKKRIIASLEDWDQNSLSFALKNIASEIILNDLSANHIVALEDKLAVIIPSKINEDSNPHNLKTRCIDYILSCNKYLGCNMSAYIGDYVPGERLQDILYKLELLDKNNVSFTSKVFDLNAERLNKGIEAKIILPNLNEWTLFLNNGESQNAVTEVKRYITELVKTENINAKLLNVFHQDVLQILYSFLEQKGIQAHQLFEDEKSEKLYVKATRSTDDIINWIEYVFDKAVSYVYEVTKSQSVIGKVKEYMNSNYDKDITRDDIARFVFLNPDYLTRIFRKATGLSLTEYLTELRIKNSMTLLATSNVQITTIATEVGYNNMNYFSKIFKKVTGVTPMEYRKKSQNRL